MSAKVRLSVSASKPLVFEPTAEALKDRGAKPTPTAEVLPLNGFEPLRSADQVGAFLGISAHTVRGWAAVGAGYGPPARRIGRKLRYRSQDVVDWVASLPSQVVS